MTDLNSPWASLPIGEKSEYMRFFIRNGISSIPEMKRLYDESMSRQSYAEGGKIHIKKANRGKFTQEAGRAGMGVQEYARHILANKDKYSPALVKRANFARNAAHWHDIGGYTGIPDEDSMYDTYVRQSVPTVELTPSQAAQFNRDTAASGGNSAFMYSRDGELVYPEELQASGITAEDGRTAAEAYNYMQGQQFGQQVAAQRDRYGVPVALASTLGPVALATGINIAGSAVSSGALIPEVQHILTVLGNPVTADTGAGAATALGLDLSGVGYGLDRFRRLSSDWNNERPRTVGEGIQDVLDLSSLLPGGSFTTTAALPFGIKGLDNMVMPVRQWNRLRKMKDYRKFLEDHSHKIEIYMRRLPSLRKSVNLKNEEVQRRLDILTQFENENKGLWPEIYGGGNIKSHVFEHPDEISFEPQGIMESLTSFGTKGSVENPVSELGTFILPDGTGHKIYADTPRSRIENVGIVNEPGRMLLNYNVDPSGTLYASIPSDKIIDDPAPKIQEKSRKVISDYVTDINRRLGGKGAVGGSMLEAANGRIGEMPGDTDIITIEENVDGIKKALELKVTGETQGVKGLKGKSRYLAQNGETDIDIIDHDAEGYATGKLAHEIYMSMYPEEYAKLAKADAETSLENWSGTLYDMRLPKPDGSGWYTDKELYNEWVNTENGILRKSNLDYMGSAKPKHARRSLTPMLDDSPYEDYVRDVRTIGKRALPEFKLFDERYPDFDYSDVEANRGFLEYVGLPEDLASDENAMRKILADWDLQTSMITRVVSMNTNDSKHIRDAVAINYAPRGGTASGAGGNNLNATRHGGGTAVGGNIQGVQQIPLSLNGKTPRNASELIGMLKRGVGDRTLTDAERETLKSLGIQAAGDFSVDGLSFILARMNDSETTDKVSHALDIPAYRGNAYGGQYVGKLFADSPERPVSYARMHVNDVPANQELGGIFKADGKVDPLVIRKAQKLFEAHSVQELENMGYDFGSMKPFLVKAESIINKYRNNSIDDREVQDFIDMLDNAAITVYNKYLEAAKHEYIKHGQVKHEERDRLIGDMKYAMGDYESAFNQYYRVSDRLKESIKDVRKAYKDYRHEKNVEKIRSSLITAAILAGTAAGIYAVYHYTEKHDDFLKSPEGLEYLNNTDPDDIEGNKMKKRKAEEAYRQRIKSEKKQSGYNDIVSADQLFDSF